MQRQGHYRELFSGIETPVQLKDGTYKIPINFDNGATTPPFKYVDYVLKDSINMYGAVHRGGQKALYSTELYEQSKVKVLGFFGLKPEDGYTVIYVKNTTEGLNLLAHELCGERGGKVIATRMEHHANDLPWRRHAMMFYIEVDEEGKLNLAELEEKLRFGQGTIQYVTVTAASNVTGYMNPIHQIAQITHQHGAKLIVDAAQLVAHRMIRMKGRRPDEKIDFLVFSGHKMYAPFGTGVVIASREVLEQKAPHLIGGGAVSAVFDQDVYFKHTPDKEEAGTPNLLGVMAVAAAMDTMKQIGMSQIAAHEEKLTKQLLEGLLSIPKVEVYGERDYKDRLGVIPFNVSGKQHLAVSRILADKAGIAVRNGCFCAQPYVARLLHVSDRERYELMLHPELPQPGMVRASLGLYNTENEVCEFLEMIKWISDH